MEMTLLLTKQIMIMFLKLKIDFNNFKTMQNISIIQLLPVCSVLQWL